LVSGCGYVKRKSGRESDVLKGSTTKGRVFQKEEVMKRKIVHRALGVRNLGDGGGRGWSDVDRTGGFLDLRGNTLRKRTKNGLGP